MPPNFPSRLIITLAALLLAIGHCRAGSFVIDWTYEYGVDAPGTKSESVYGKLLYKGDELPKEYQHVVTPIGEFIYLDHFGIVPKDKIAWVPCGKLPGYAGRDLQPAGTETEVQELLTSNDSTFRRVINSHPVLAPSAEACIKGPLDSVPAGVGKDWFYVVAKTLWVNPQKIQEVLKAKLPGR